MITDQSSRLRSHVRALCAPGLLLYLGGYAALLVWFKLADVYHTQFATRGALVVIYNAFRVLFIFYLFWIVYAPGRLVLRWVGGRSSDSGSLEHLALSFFAGAGLWHIGLLALGYLNLYSVPVAVAITVPAVAFSYPSACAAISSCWRRVPSWRTMSLHARVMACCLGMVSGFLLITKGLYPAGAHDYFTHYFYYYQAVIEHGGLWPNEVWYHFYYSKGAGLFFLGMLLTDPLAPQLVTFCFMAGAAAALYLTVKDFAPKTNWPAASVLLFMGFYIFTPGWGEFEKQHELNTALILGVIWMAQRANSSIAFQMMALSAGIVIVVALLWKFNSTNR